MNRKPIGLALLLALALGCSSALAQDETPTAVTNQNRSGDLPFSTSIGTDVESVDIGSGGLSVRLPIVSRPGRGMNFNFMLRYDPNFLVVATRKQGVVTYQKWNVELRNWSVTNGLGWEPNQPRVTWVSSSFTCQPGGEPPIKWEGYIYHDESGAKHPLSIRFEGGDCGTGPYQAGVTEGPDMGAAGIWSKNPDEQIPPEITLADGTKPEMTQLGGGGDPLAGGRGALFGIYTDSNGNKKTETAGGQDTLGRVIFTQTNGTNQVLYNAYDSTGTLRTWTANYANIALNTSFGISGPYGPIQEITGGLRKAITSLVLPNGRSYSFQHESTYGGITRIDLSSGAYITYTWGTYTQGWQDTHRYVSSRTVHVDGQSYTWTFSPTGTLTCPPGGDTCTQMTVTDPNGNQSEYLFQTGRVLSARLFSGAVGGNPVRQHKIDYLYGDVPPYKPLVPIRITTTLEDGRVSKKEFDYETFTYHEEFCSDPPLCGYGTWPIDHVTSRGNVKEIREYEWGSGAPGPLIRRTTKDYLHTNNSNYLTRNIVSKIIAETVYDGSNPSATLCTELNGCKARTEFEYDSTAITSTSGAPQHDYTNYPSTFTYRGNATKVKKWRNTDGALLTTSYVYDDLGNIRSITDPGLHSTTWDYTDNWSGSGCLPPANSLAYVKQVTNHLGHRIQLSRFPCTGAVQSRKDENDLLVGRPGTTFTYDLFGRMLTRLETDGGQTTSVYNDVPPVSVTTTTKITSTLNLVSSAIQDDLGRVKQTQLTSDPEGTVFTDTTYDALGRTATVTNPYRSVSDPTYGITETQYDALSRVTKVIPPDGTSTTNNVTTTYAGPTVTVTDQAGKVRKSENDALGRLIRVWEPNSSGSLVNQTRYFYDTLDNLTCVLQLSTDAEPASCTAPSATWRPRTFTYNSLSQLLTAANPESGAISYTYDSDGNVLTKVAPKPNQTGGLTVTATYTYDVLHRLTQKSYNDGATATVKYGYDALALTGCTTAPPSISPMLNPIGRRTAMCDASGATAWSYDPEGAILTEKRTVIGSSAITNTFSYTYNLDGSLASLTYPSGRTITYTASGAGRTLSAVDAANSLNYVTQALYAPHGALTSLKNGVPMSTDVLTTTNSYNNRLQPVVLSAASPSQTLLSFSYSFDQDPGAGVKNNGNVVQIQNNRDSSRTQSFTYDELNRVKEAWTSGNLWGNQFLYDIWGNLNKKQACPAGSPCDGKPLGEWLDQLANTKNQFTGTGFAYDAAGNMTNAGWGVLTYDAENRLTNAAGVTYTYDGDGKRVKKSTGMLYWTGMGSDALAESDLAGTFQREFIFFNGKRTARRDAVGTVFYYFSDHLGSASVVSYSTGTIVEESDYYPFGGERIITNADPNQYKFTGNERDAESGLDYFGARHYGSTFGRFIQSDLPFADWDFENPQSLNLYGYVRNNPLNAIDPTGRGSITLAGKALNKLRKGGEVAQVFSAVKEDAKKVLNSNLPAIDRFEALGSVLSEVVLPVSMNDAAELGTAAGLGLAAFDDLGPPKAYEVGTYEELKSTSVSGDELDIHHAPQQHPASQVIPGYDPNTAPAMRVPTQEHIALNSQNIKGQTSIQPRDLAAKTIRDIRNQTNAPPSATRKLLDLVKRTFKEVLTK